MHELENQIGSLVLVVNLIGCTRYLARNMISITSGREDQITYEIHQENTYKMNSSDVARNC